MHQLSIIIPVYNKVAYLKSCVGSVLRQTYPQFELILVNDGSTDGSGALCDELALLDERIKVHHQENKGVSAARNTGIQLATGNFIGFIDADDAIHEDMYKVLMEKALIHDADVVGCGVKIVFPFKTVEHQEPVKTRVLNHNEGLAEAINGTVERNVTNKIFRSNLAKQLLFEGRLLEDALYLVKFYLLAQRSVFINTPYYQYIKRDNSVSMAPFDEKYFETLTVTQKIVDIMQATSPKHLEQAFNFDFVQHLSILNLILLGQTDKYLQHMHNITTRLQQRYKQLDGSKLVWMKHRIAYRLFQFAPTLYKNAMRGYCKLTKAEAIVRTSGI